MDLAAAQRLARWHELVAGGQHDDAWAAGTRDLGQAETGDGRCGQRRQLETPFQYDVAGAGVGTRGADVRAWLDGCERGNDVALLHDTLERDHSVGAVGDHAACGDRGGRPGCEWCGIVPGQDVRRQLPRRRCRGINRKAIHRRIGVTG